MVCLEAPNSGPASAALRVASICLSVPVKGIGPLGASILLSVIGNVREFPDEGRLASYFGIVPHVHNSNEIKHSGHITKRGSKLGRTASLQCALIAIVLAANSWASSTAR